MSSIVIETAILFTDVVMSHNCGNLCVGCSTVLPADGLISYTCKPWH